MAFANAALVNWDIAECAVHDLGDAPQECDAAYGGLLDALGGSLAALADADCVRLLGPIVPGATMARGARLPGTSHELDPVAAAFCVGVAACWSGGRDPARENFGALWALMDYRSRRAHDGAEPPLRVDELLAALTRARRIQAALEAEPGYPSLAMAGKVAVRVASAAVATQLLGGDLAQIAAASTHAWLDGAPLPAHPRATPIATRTRWAAADATSRGVRLALMAVATTGHPGASSGGRRLALPDVPPVGVSACIERFAAPRSSHVGARRGAMILARVTDRAALAAMPVHELSALLVHNA